MANVIESENMSFEWLNIWDKFKLEILLWMNGKVTTSWKLSLC